MAACRGDRAHRLASAACRTVVSGQSGTPARAPHALLRNQAHPSNPLQVNNEDSCHAHVFWQVQLQLQALLRLRKLRMHLSIGTQRSLVHHALPHALWAPSSDVDVRMAWSWWLNAWTPCALASRALTQWVVCMVLPMRWRPYAAGVLGLQTVRRSGM